LLRLKYHDSIADALADLGKAEEVNQVFAGFQKSLYVQPACCAQGEFLRPTHHSCPHRVWFLF
jgi:hypothetical protein